MLELFYKKVLKNEIQEPLSLYGAVYKRNLGMSRYVAIIVLCISAYWLIVDKISSAYTLNNYSRISVILQILVAVYLFFLPLIAKKKRPDSIIVRLSFIVFYFIVILGAGVIIISKNMEIIASVGVTQFTGVSAAAFYVFIMLFMSLPYIFDSVFLFVITFIGLVCPDILFRTSTYSLFAHGLLWVCFVLAYIFYRKIVLESVNREAEVDHLTKNLRDYSVSDSLTSILNRRAMDMYIDYLISESKTKKIGVVFFDVDYFKKYNDYYGHVTGDSILRGVALAAEKSLGYRDDSFIFRYGGEEFVVIIDNADEKAVVDVMRNIRDAVYNANFVRDDIPDFDRITITAGGTIEVLPNTTNDYVNAADNQLYIGKNSHRNGIYYGGKCVDDITVDGETEISGEYDSITYPEPESDRMSLQMLLNAISIDVVTIASVNCKSRTVTVYKQIGSSSGANYKINRTDVYDTAVTSYANGSVHPNDRVAFRHFMNFDNIMDQLKNEDSISSTFRIYKEGYVVEYIKIRCIRIGAKDNFGKFVLAFTPVSSAVNEKNLTQNLEFDELTGVYSKQAFFHYAKQLMDDNPDTYYSISISDIENFKLVNSVHGEAKGDEVLRITAEALNALPGIIFVGRYGADQFVIMSEASALEDLKRVHDEIDAIRQQLPVPYLVLKFGINNFVDRNESIAAICDKALLALKSIKHTSDKQIAFYDRQVIQQHYKEQLYETKFEQALKNGEFVVWFQPKYNAFTRNLNGAEALVRWKDHKSFIPPGEFIPIFEASGLITRLDEFIFRSVCQKQREFIDAGYKPVPISINMSRATLYQPKVVVIYQRIIEEYNIPKEIVPIELTESAAINTSNIKELVDEFKDAGFILHMDDFGSGFSSLTELSVLPFDVIKLDKALIDAIGSDKGEEILRHIIELAHFLKMEVIAEGVEYVEQLNFLKKINCNSIQGFLFGKPMASEDFSNLFIEFRKKVDTDTMALGEGANIGSLRLTNSIKREYLQAMESIYMTMHAIDLEEDTVVEFATTMVIKEYVNRMHNAAFQMQEVMRHNVSDEYLQAALRFSDLSTLASRMKGKRTIAEEFGGIHFAWFRAQFIAVGFTTDEEVKKVIFTTQVVEADKRRKEKIIQASVTDELTGVYNSKAFDSDIAELERSGEDGLQDIAVMIIDLNGLSRINDDFGHFAGDEAIVGAAECVNDVFGKIGKVYRTGGDIFCAVFKADDEQLKVLEKEFDGVIESWTGNEVRKISLSYGAILRKDYPDCTMAELVGIAEEKMNDYKVSYYARRKR